VPRDGFAFSIRVRGKKNLIRTGYESLEATDYLSAALGELIGRLERLKAADAARPPLKRRPAATRNSG
jgi:hypothetical protein